MLLSKMYQCHHTLYITPRLNTCLHESLINIRHLTFSHEINETIFWYQNLMKKTFKTQEKAK
jgi:hypothetical protein